MAKEIKKAKSKAAALVRVPQNRDEVVESIQQIGTLQTLIAGHKARVDEAIRALGKELEEVIAPLGDELKQLEAGVQAYCEAHRLELTGGKVKFHDFGTGRVAWRARPPKVMVRGVEAVIAACKTLGLEQFVRVKEEVNKDAMLAEPDKAVTISGVSIQSEAEDFVIEPVALSTGVGATHTGRAA